MTTTHIMSDETGQLILAQLQAISQALDDGALSNSQIDTVLADQSPTGAGFLDGGGLKRFFDGLQAQFAAISHNHSGDALTPASVAATGVVSGSSVSDSVGSLASLRESVSLTLKFTKLTTSQITIPNGQSVSLPDGYTSATMALICGYGYDGMRFTHFGAAGSINIPVAATSSTIGKLSVNVGTGTITNSAGVNVTIAAVYAVTMNM